MEYFSKLRHFGSSLERDCEYLKKSVEDEPDRENSGKMCLDLRETLREIKDFKGEMSSTFEDFKKKDNFDEFLSACKRAVAFMDQEILDTEGYLKQYGYVPSSDPLQKLKNDQEVSHSEDEKSMDNKSTDDEADLNRHCSTDQTVKSSNTSEENSQNESSTRYPSEDTDKFTPQKPKTFTKMIQPMATTELDAPATSSNSQLPSPLCPATMTPLLKRKHNYRDDESDDSHTKVPAWDSPLVPPTFTPMINKNCKVSLEESPMFAASAYEAPFPPQFSTVKVGNRARVKDEEYTTDTSFEFSLPQPPSVSCVSLMKPNEQNL